MATRFAKPIEASQVTHVADMPPLEVVTEGIPPQEHVEFAPAAQVEPLHAVREGWGRMWAWALAGVMGLLLLVAGVFAYTQDASTGDPALTVVPPVGSEVGEPASRSVYSGLLEGPALPYIPYMSIAAIPSIADVSIAPIPAIEPMPAMSIPAIPDMSIPDIRDMSIPSIPDMSIPDMGVPAISSTPLTPSTPPIAFPTFPSIPSISVPSIPPFPDM